MRALVIVDGALVLEDRPDPTPGSTEVVVEVAAAGLNAADLLQRQGFYPAPPGSPVDVPGLEVAGTICALGASVDDWQIGDRVMAVVGGGGQATHCIVDAAHLLPIPTTTSMLEAGGFAEAFTTAYDAVVTQGRLASGDRLLVTGAAGGVGTAALQLGRALGATVIASVRDAARREAVSQLGADEVIDPAETADHGPYDVVVELVGAASLTGGVLRSLGIGARVIVIGVGGGGATAELNLLGLMSARATIGGSTLRARSRTDKAVVAAAMTKHVLPLLERGALVVPILETFGLDDAENAYERFAAGSKLGKIILVPERRPSVER